VRRLNQALAALPLVSSRDRRRWRDVERVLAPLAGHRALSVEIRERPGRFRLRLAD
jgi:hypothetical protein